MGFTHRMPVPHADPRERRFAAGRAPFGVWVQRNLLEVKLPWQRRHGADAGFAGELAHRGRYGRCGMFVCGSCVPAVGTDGSCRGRELSRRILDEPTSGIKQSGLELDRFASLDL